MKRIHAGLLGVIFLLNSFGLVFADEDIYLPIVVFQELLPEGKIVFCVTYENFEEDRGGIYVVDDDAAGMTRVPGTDSDDCAPSWAPDGSRIAFRRFAPNSDVDDLYVMNADGTEAVNLEGHIRRGVTARIVDWAPEGTRLVFSDVQFPGIVPSLYVMHLDNLDSQDIPPEGYAHPLAPSWSPGGTKIAFHANPDDFNYWFVDDIYTVNSDGTEVTKLTNADLKTGEGGGTKPVWSPGGTKIVFERDHAIYVMNADGTEQVKVAQSAPSTTTIYYYKDPTWSPDGTKIVFVKSELGPCCNRSQEIWVMNADGTSQHLLFDVSSYLGEIIVAGTPPLRHAGVAGPTAVMELCCLDWVQMEP